MPKGDNHIEPTPRTSLRRFSARGVYDREPINAILDEGLICHVGFVDPAGSPIVIPTAYVRADDQLYIHGSAASRTLKTLAGGVDVCITVTLTDGLVLARTAFNHSFNYRSVVIFGQAEAVTDPEEKLTALTRLTEGLVPSRWNDVRPPTAQEIKASALLKVPLTEASAKVRSGPPGDEGEDLEWETWAGVIPFEMTVLPAVTDPRIDPAYPIPDYVKTYSRTQPRMS